MKVREGRSLRPLDRLLKWAWGRLREGICREQVSESDPPPKGDVRVPGHIVPASETDRDRGLERTQVEQDAGDRAGGLAVHPLPRRAPLFDEERGRREVRTMMGPLERHLVAESPPRMAKSAEGGGHPSRCRRDEGPRLAAKLREARISDRVHREARTTALGPVFGQVHDEVDPLVEGGFEIAVEVVAVQVEFGDRDENHVPQAPRRPTAERFIPRRRARAPEPLLLEDPRLLPPRAREEPQPGRDSIE